MKTSKPLTPLQVEILDTWMARKQLGLSQIEIAQQFGMSDRNLRRIISTDEAKEYMTSRAVAFARESLNDVLDVVTKRALEGKVCKWAELYFRVVGVLNGDNDKPVEVEKQHELSMEELEAETNRLLASLEDYTYDEQPVIKRVQ